VTGFVLVKCGGRKVKNPCARPLRPRPKRGVKHPGIIGTVVGDIVGGKRQQRPGRRQLSRGPDGGEAHCKQPKLAGLQEWVNH